MHHLADAGEAQHLVAEPGLGVPQPGVHLAVLLSGVYRRQQQPRPHRELLAPPQFEQRVVAFRCHAEPAGVHHAGQAGGVQVGEHGGGRALLPGRLGRRDGVEAERERAHTVDPAGRLAGEGVPLDVTARRVPGQLVQPGLEHRGGVEHRRLVESLDVHRMITGHRVQFTPGRLAGFGELARMPAADGPDPLAGLGPLGRGADAGQGAVHVGNSGPVQLTGPGQAGSYRVDVPVDQAGDHPPPGQVDHPRFASDQLPQALVGAVRQHPSVVDGEGGRFRTGHRIASRPDPAVEVDVIRMSHPNSPLRTA